MSALLSVDRKSPPAAFKRLGVVGAAVAAAVAVWAVAEMALTDLRQPGFDGAAPQELGVTSVAIAAVVGAALAWASLFVLERVTSHGRRLWLGLAVLVLLVSMGGPFSGEGVSLGNRLVLALLHVTVAAVLIPGLYRTSGRRPRA